MDRTTARVLGLDLLTILSCVFHPTVALQERKKEKENKLLNNKKQIYIIL